ncbi:MULTISPECIES: lipoprotein LpqH [Mycolicibacterium]|uniref:Lipoprotein LpqH n=1 Tax=Mycolicibacterium mageritense TaxID=53462 RepID=A0AAI8XMD4_MYCME|nr:lipoprotein LpqH [Mycolicibacterium mageritense]MBN3458328.1 lipoprotein LpqH [Mycobacterium sp. DSM 3803]OKH75090.1 hypothetical protein EB73_04590 [Mycobacterium sp. SWH-M3]MCC9182870.1 lipoprotein LpqH [Mycolicibacterium mageritense]TXI63330.1 MAG: hypothetical protein E6Q55_09875 [Mycolicibacterium mageritense]CDO22169.1 lipoprotein LpqH [Mycolicibacterium mageritense DSM 44476 = CIP 104973]
MKRGFLVVVGGAAVVIAGLSGCSSDEKKSESTASATATASAEGGGASVTTGSGTAKVTIDGKDHPVSGSIACVKQGGNVNIALGQGMTGITAVVSEADPPAVTAVQLGNIDGVMLQYGAGAPGGSAEATKDGNKYTIKGNATGADMANPMAGVVTKPFELEVTCP